MNKEFDQLYNLIDNTIDTHNDLIEKWIYDYEVDIEYEMRKEIEKEYGMPYWKVLDGLDESDKDIKKDIDKDEKMIELKDWNTKNLRYFKIIPSEKSKTELGLPDDFCYVVIVDLKRNKIMCDCLGNETTGNCYHIKQVKEKLKINY